jgi:DNA replication protein DnaC
MLDLEPLGQLDFRFSEHADDLFGGVSLLCHHDLLTKNVYPYTNLIAGVGFGGHVTQRRIKAAGFPVIKSFETFDFKAIPSLNKLLALELARGEYITKRQNVLAVGNSGTGKTHLALALGLAACQKGFKVRFTTAAALVNEMIEARDEKRLLRLQKQIAKLNLLIIDEMGFVPFSKTGAELLFELISQRYERGSVLITSNLPFDEWPDVFGSERLTSALLDRLTHHVHILEMNGDSYRLKQSKTRKDKK